jgi:transcriptional regulator with XRE-family HTH domain
MKKLSSRLKDATFRHAFAVKTVGRRIAHRIKAIREDRKMSQGELAQKAHTSQSVLSRWEKPDYGSYTLKTLQQIASACDVVLWVDFISHEEFRRRIKSESAWEPVPTFEQTTARADQVEFVRGNYTSIYGFSRIDRIEDYEQLVATAYGRFQAKRAGTPGESASQVFQLKKGTVSTTAKGLVH